LADRIALVVVPAAGEYEELGFEVGQPRRLFGQQSASNFAEATAIGLALSPSGFTR
jgi:hypothetical protein